MKEGSSQRIKPAQTDGRVNLIQRKVFPTQDGIIENQRTTQVTRKIKQKPAIIRDARENIKQATETKKPATFPKIVHNDSLRKQTPTIMKVTTSTYAQTEPKINTADTQIDFLIETSETYKNGVSRVDPIITTQEDTQPNKESLTMSGTQLEASHELIVEGLLATIDKETITEIGEDTPLYKKNLQKVQGVSSMTASTRRDRNMCPLDNFVKKQDWEALKLSFGQ